MVYWKAVISGLGGENMTKLTKEELIGVASRAWVEVSDEDLDFYLDSILHTLETVDKLQEVDIEGIEPMTHVLQSVNVMRDDVIADVLDREEMLTSVKDHKSGEIKVPAIL